RDLSVSHSFFVMSVRRPPSSTRFPYTTLFRSGPSSAVWNATVGAHASAPNPGKAPRYNCGCPESRRCEARPEPDTGPGPHLRDRSEEHTSELQSRFDLVCRLLLEKKNTNTRPD